MNTEITISIWQFAALVALAAAFAGAGMVLLLAYINQENEIKARRREQARLVKLIESFTGPDDDDDDDDDPELRPLIPIEPEHLIHN